MRDFLYAPWRHDYVNKNIDKKSEQMKNDCVFCHQFEQNDDDRFYIVKRFEKTAIMLNYYPYNAGHIMILPYEHVKNLTELSKQARSEMMDVAAFAMPVMEEAIKAQGFNVGFNLGSAAGGGIPAHVHMHVLPRWRGDTNFLEVLGEVKLISSDLEKTYQKLKEAFSGRSI